MRKEVKKEILHDLTQTIEILKQRELQDVEQLKDLSDHSIEDVALYKNLDLISITVLIYSIYKVVRQMNEEEYKDLVAELEFAKKHLLAGNLSRYNKSVKSLFQIVKGANASVKTHLQDVMNAARIKKGAVLLQKGLSLGQAAGLMGLSNWDLQQYAGRTRTMEAKFVPVSAKKRLETALKIFVDNVGKGGTIFFDAGPIITLVMSRLIWILPELKKKFGGKFYITPGVKRELVERPLGIKRFEFEALQVMKLISDGTLEVYDKFPKSRVEQLQKLANSSFKIRNKNMDVIQTGEMESVTCALQTNASAVIMDERTLRLLIENNKEMEKLLEIRFKKDVVVNKERMDNFSKQLKSVKIIRSIELVAAAYKLGLLNHYMPKQRGGKATLLDSVLWAAKYNGSAVTEDEINEMKDILL